MDSKINIFDYVPFFGILKCGTRGILILMYHSVICSFLLILVMCLFLKEPINKETYTILMIAIYLGLMDMANQIFKSWK